jgi:hypothetical protein
MRTESRGVTGTTKISDVEILLRKPLMQQNFKMWVIHHPLTETVTDQNNAL